MDDLFSQILLAVALIFVIEGLIYAVFPRHIQDVMKMALELPLEKFRYYGASMVALGVMGVWLVQRFII